MTLAVFNERARWSLPEGLVDRLRDAAGDRAQIRAATTRAQLLEQLPGTDYLVGFPLTDEQFAQQGGELKWIQLTGSGGDLTPTLIGAMDRGVRITSAASIRAPQVAEHAMALLLTLFRRLDLTMRAQTEHRWASTDVAPQIRNLSGATVGLIAVGCIGQEIAQRLKAFGVTVVATRRDPSNPYMYVDQVVPTERINDLMEICDAIIVATPRIPATDDLIGARQFKVMRPGMVLIDVGRGGVVNQNAMLDALRRGRLAAAGLDVFATEPLPPASPLWTMPNVIVTPHISAASPHYWEHAVEVIATNLNRMLSGEPMIDEITHEWLDQLKPRKSETASR